MSIPKINSLNVDEINTALRMILKQAELLISKNKAELTGFSKIVYGPPGPAGKNGILNEYATVDLPELTGFSIAFDSTLQTPVYFHSGSWYKLKDDSLVKSFA